MGKVKAMNAMLQKLNSSLQAPIGDIAESLKDLSAYLEVYIDANGSFTRIRFAFA